MKLLNGEKEGCSGSCETCTACDENNNDDDHGCSESTGEVGGCCGGACGGGGADMTDIEDLVSLKKGTEAEKGEGGDTFFLSDQNTDFFQPKVRRRHLLAYHLRCQL